MTGNGNRSDDLFDHVGITHPRHAALCSDVGRYALQRHHSNRAGILCDFGLIRCDDVHDHSALQHLSHAALDTSGAGQAGEVEWGW